MLASCGAPFGRAPLSQGLQSRRVALIVGGGGRRVATRAAMLERVERVMDDREQLIRDRAYAIWQREGRPAGRESEHWQAAAREIEEELGSSGGAKEPSAAAATGGAAGEPAGGKQAGATGTKKPAATRAKPAAAAKKPSAAAKDKAPGKSAKKNTDK